MKTGQNIGIVSSERHSLINICRFTISHLLGVTILCGALLFPSSSPAQTQLDPQPGLILVNPTPSKGPVVNPYKGWVLYGSVKNQTAAELALASTAYRRFNWSEIQPEEGVFNWKIIDDEIKGWNAAGKQFAFGVMCANSHYNDFWVTPKWVFDAGAMYKTFDLTDPKMATSGTPGLKLVPVFDDPIFMQKLESFIKALAARYDGNPALAFIDIRSYGNWGEGHMSPFSSQNIPVKSYLAHVQIHRNAFKKTQLQLPWGLKGYSSVYKWAVENGIGLRRDGVCGNSDGSETASCAGLVPGVFEFYADYETMLKLGWWEGKKDSAGRGFKLEECVENGMPTWCDLSRGGKSGQVLLDSERPLIEKLANRLGYHFVLKGVQFPAVFQPNTPVPMNAMWENEGVAPIFVPASVAYALLDSAGNMVKSFPAPNAKPSDWKPAKSVISQDTLSFTDVLPGTYSLAVGILTPNQPKPSIKIAIESESRNGWQILGQVQVQNDTTASVLNLPSIVTASATSPSGAVVNDTTATELVVVSVTDAVNNTSSAGTFTVTVKDTTAPVLKVPSNISVEATNASGAPVNYGAATATDNVTANPVIVYTKANGSTFPIGSTTVTVTATDAANNVSSGTFAVTVKDTTAPVLKVPANITVEATNASGALVTYSAATATDNVTASPVIVYSKASGSTFPIGTTTVTVTATDAANNTSSANFTVTVRDTTAPVLKVPSNITVEATNASGAPVNYSAATATDNVTASPVIVYSKASGSTFPIGTTTVTVTVTDAANNTSSGNFSVTVRDTQKPTIRNIPAKLVLNTDASGTVVFPDYRIQMEVSDNIGVDTIQQKPAAGKVLQAGTMTVQWSVRDAAGNEATAGAVVEVREFPRIVTQPKELKVRSNANVVFDVKAEGYGPLSYQWKRNGISLGGGTTALLSLPNVQGAQAGTYTVTVTNPVGSVQSEPVSLSFVDFKTVAGAYQALLKTEETEASSEVSMPGRLSVNVTGTAGLSGKLECFGETFAFSGAFTPEMVFEKTITRTGRSSLVVTLKLDAVANNLGATVKDSESSFEISGTMVLQPVYTVKNPAPLAGVYTMAMSHYWTLGGELTVCGVASLNVSALGMVSVTGALADGTILNSTAQLQRDGTVPYYCGIYSTVFPKAGYISGTVELDAKGVSSRVLGSMEWHKPKQAKGLRAAGFTQTLGVGGSVYKVPGAKELVLAKAGLSFRATDSAELSATLKSGNAFVVTPNNASAVVLSLNKATGVVTGSLTDVKTKKKRVLTGVVLQTHGEVAGFYPTDADAGEWLLADPKP